MTQETEIVDAVHAAKRLPRFRTQSGQVVERSDGFWIRFYDWASGDDPIGERKKVSRWLAPPDTDKLELDSLRRDFIKKVNAQQRGFRLPDPKERTAGQFWIIEYFPVIEANRAWATANSYKIVWETYCAEHFSTKVLTRYTTADANKFLTDCATKAHAHGERLAKGTVTLIRSIASGLFRYAQNRGLIDRNPFTDVALIVRYKPAKPKVIYTLAETAKVINAIPRTDAKLAAAFCLLLGMRPAEAAAIQWEDVEDDRVWVRRAAPEGHLGETKTDGSLGYVVIGKRVAPYLAAWRKECGKAEGFLFKRRNSDSVVNMKQFGLHCIGEYAKKAIGDRWHGLYPGRRGTSDAMYHMTGDTRASSATLRNSKTTVDKHYIGPDYEAARAASALLDKQYAKEVKKLSKS
jgi:integrase